MADRNLDPTEFLKSLDPNFNTTGETALKLLKLKQQIDSPAGLDAANTGKPKNPQLSSLSEGDEEETDLINSAFNKNIKAPVDEAINAGKEALTDLASSALDSIAAFLI